MKISKRIKKYIIKIGGVILIVLIIGNIILGVYEKNKSEEAIYIVANSTFNVNPDATFEMSINQYLTNAKWSSYRNSDGRIVSITGKKRSPEQDHTYNIELNYLVDEEQGTYTFYSGYKDGVKMNSIDELILKIKCFDLVNLE